MMWEITSTPREGFFPATFDDQKEKSIGIPIIDSYPKDPCMEYLPTLGLF